MQIEGEQLRSEGGREAGIIKGVQGGDAGRGE